MTESNNRGRFSVWLILMTSLPLLALEMLHTTLTDRSKPPLGYVSLFFFSAAFSAPLLAIGIGTMLVTLFRDVSAARKIQALFFGAVLIVAIILFWTGKYPDL